MTGFGEHLKREREMRGVSLEEICTATRIGTRFLEALENEQWNLLPGGIFNRGFVRSVARFLGLDEDGMVAEYELATNGQAQSPPAVPLVQQIPQQARQVERRPQPQTDGRTPNNRRFQIDRRASMGALLAAIVIAIVWLGWHFYAGHAARNIVTTAAPAAASSAADGAAKSGDGSAATQSGQSSAKAPLPAPAPPSLLLKIEAAKSTTVTVSTDGKKVFKGNIASGQSRTFEGRDSFEISANNAGAVLLELNGQTLAPMGPPGHSGKIILTRRDLKTVAGGPD